MEFLLYLAGPVTGGDYKKVSDWREYVGKKLPKEIIPVSPLRGREYLSKDKSIKNFDERFTLSSKSGIVARVRMDVERCDMLFVNFLGVRKVSIGTVMEIAWADAWRKPIVTVMDKGNIHEHVLIRGVSGFNVVNLDEAIEIVKAVLLPKL